MTRAITGTLLLRGGSVVSVHTGETFRADVLVEGDRIRAVLAPDRAELTAAEELDVTGRLVVPGYIDAHMHVESSLVPPAEFEALTLHRGTTTVLADPHEIVNVAGREGMAWMVEQGRGLRQDIRWAVPSCVPSLHGFETAGADLDADDIAEMLGWGGVTTLGEVMDYRAVIGGDPRTLAIIDAARRAGVRLDGHCPHISGADLNEYLWAGVDSDHTKNSPEVTVEKARLGMVMMLQEKCLRPELVEALLALPVLPDFCLVSDDVAPDAAVDHGHLDHLAGVALDCGLPALAALRALTLHPARRLGLDDRGVVAPGRRADLIVLRDLTSFVPEHVVCGGVPVGEPTPRPTPSHPFGGTVRLPEAPDGRWRTDLPDGEYPFRALRVNPVDTYTEPDEIVLPVRDGVVEWEGRCAVVTVVERHTGAASRQTAPVLGFAPTPGAFATTYAHDSHNLTVVATSAGALAEAAGRVRAAGGGIALVREDSAPVELKLPIGGVMSDLPADEVAAAAREIRSAVRAWGWDHANPFMSLTTMTLPVSPQVKITDRGLVRVVERDWEPAVRAGE
ncbi:adenine deaminase C-terminal domain-containing protein [Pseudonocardia sp. HH130629-09]|uniref:adenine deaminase C-terminal domain-containing protein n=1 Tax=Pseudonocardia sp. HH130629-09 TaxID=1641402 RepID=UPI0006CB5EE8|nr:adenine deaminase C-terminal domain-containing protein [Pseudonocardia sp. HH130629-09]ALE81715.1 adenine deaminase [Pseudonocardia sp. HH130629-09]